MLTQIAARATYSRAARPPGRGVLLRGSVARTVIHSYTTEQEYTISRLSNRIAAIAVNAVGAIGRIAKLGFELSVRYG